MKKKQDNRATVLRTKIKALRDKLKELKDYKALIAAEGIAPDADDKARESKLIVQLLRHEKDLAAIEGKPAKKKSFKSNKNSPSRSKKTTKRR